MSTSHVRFYVLFVFSLTRVDITMFFSLSRVSTSHVHYYVLFFVLLPGRPTYVNICRIFQYTVSFYLKFVACLNVFSQRVFYFEILIPLYVRARDIHLGIKWSSFGGCYTFFGQFLRFLSYIGPAGGSWLRNIFGHRSCPMLGLRASAF